MTANWMTDPVHGDKAGYVRVAVKLIEKMEDKPHASTPDIKDDQAGPSRTVSRHPDTRNTPGRGHDSSDSGRGGGSSTRSCCQRNNSSVNYYSDYDNR
jgi:hypothetical protein